MQKELPPAEKTNRLLRRLWREHVRHHRGRLVLILVLTAITAATQALYPIIIDRAIEMFEHRDRRILYQVPLLVLGVTSVKALTQYFQAVLVQQVVLMVIRGLQGRMFAHLVHADLARLERDSPAALAARFTTDATICFTYSGVIVKTLSGPDEVTRSWYGRGADASVRTASESAAA